MKSVFLVGFIVFLSGFEIMDGVQLHQP